jgi:hypothetical protein
MYLRPAAAGFVAPMPALAAQANASLISYIRYITGQVDFKHPICLVTRFRYQLAPTFPSFHNLTQRSTDLAPTFSRCDARVVLRFEKDEVPRRIGGWFTWKVYRRALQPNFLSSSCPRSASKFVKKGDSGYILGWTRMRTNPTPVHRHNPSTRKSRNSLLPVSLSLACTRRLIHEPTPKLFAFERAFVTVLKVQQNPRSGKSTGYTV